MESQLQVTHCKARTIRGQPCGAFPIKGSDYCFRHDPELAEARKRASTKGGFARHGRTVGSALVPVATASGNARVLNDSDAMPDLDELERGLWNDWFELGGLERSHAKARSRAYVSKAILEVREYREWGPRIAQLEEAILILSQQEESRYGGGFGRIVKGVAR